MTSQGVFPCHHHLWLLIRDKLMNLYLEFIFFYKAMCPLLKSTIQVKLR